MNEHTKNIEELFELGKPIDDAINTAVREVVKRHHQAHQPVASW